MQSNSIEIIGNCNMDFMCKKKDTFPNIKAHMSQLTDSHFHNSHTPPKIQFQGEMKWNDQCVICSITKCIYLIFEIFARFLLVSYIQTKMEQFRNTHKLTCQAISWMCVMIWQLRVVLSQWWIFLSITKSHPKFWYEILKEIFLVTINRCDDDDDFHTEDHAVNRLFQTEIQQMICFKGK